MKKMSMLLIACMTSAFSFAADLQVSAKEAKEKGAIYFALYQEDGYMKKPVASAKAEPEKPTVVFKDLAPGKYALSMYQDVNGNGKLDRSMLGALAEPYGFSNDATVKFGPPKFSDAAIQINNESQSINIKLH